VCVCVCVCVCACVYGSSALRVIKTEGEEVIGMKHVCSYLHVPLPLMCMDLVLKYKAGQDDG